MSAIIAIDPGNVQSAYVVWDGKRISDKGILPNEILRANLLNIEASKLYIEMIASYGMSVGATVFETVVWIGRYMEVWQPKELERVYRKTVKMHHCGSMKAKDGNIRQALIDKYGAPGTKKAPGLTYGLSKDLWQAFAIATYATERNELQQKATK